MSSIRSLRNNRSSRYSSPATFTVNSQDSEPTVQETIEQSGHGGKDDVPLGPWVEPAPRHAVPSFEDTRGIERGGVLEHMQPLGVAPNQRLLKKLNIHHFRPSLSARATPVWSEGPASPSVEPISAGARDEPISPHLIDPELLQDATSPVTQVHTPPRPQSQPQSQRETHPIQQPQLISFPVQEPPIGESSSQPSAQMIMSPPRGRPAKKEVEEMRVYPDENIASPGFSTVSRQSRASLSNTSMSEQQKKDRYDALLQGTVDRAVRDGNHELAAGLRRVWAESGRDEVMTALDNISKYKGSVRIEQFKVFKHYIKKGIRKYRRSADEHSNGDTPKQDPPPPPQQKPVAYLGTFHANIKRPSSVDPVVQHNSPIKSPLTLRTNQMETVSKLSPSKLHIQSPSQTSPSKLSVHSPSQLQRPISELPAADDDPIPPSSPPKLMLSKPSPQKRRASSDSPLSSPKSISSLASSPEPVPDLPLDPEFEDQAAADAKPAKSLAPRQAPSRAASGRVTRLSGSDQQQTDLSQHEAQNTRKLNTVDHSSEAKRRKLAKEINLPPDYDQEAVDRKRREFESTLQHDNREGRQTVHLRLRHDIPEGEDELTPIISEIRPPAPRIHPNSLVHAVVQVSSPVTAEFPVTNGVTRKRDYDEFTRDDTSSRLSTPETTLSDAPPTQINSRLNSAAPNSRGMTPRAAKNGISKAHQPTRGRSSLRTMISPKKNKKDGSRASATRAGVDSDPMITNGANTDPDEIQNADECRACGDAGLLILCESCPNSFHPGCLEPPLDPEDPKLADDQKWYCPECEGKLRPQVTAVNGLLGELISNITEIPRFYSLPIELRNYFENITTGPEGEYVETVPPPLNKKWAPRADNNGAIKMPNYRDARDKHGHLRLCYKCAQGTDGEREMMPCDYCTHEWHLDCLDPPLATVPKRIAPDGKAPPPWRCPLHIDHDMLEVSRAGGLAVGTLGRRPRLRRPRKQNAIQPAAKPVPTNNGIIDVQLESEKAVDLKAVDNCGAVSKIPEKGIMLDFIRKANYERYTEYQNKEARGIVSHVTRAQHWMPSNPRFRDRPAPLPTEEDIFGEENIEQDRVAREDQYKRLQAKSHIEQQTVYELEALSRARDSVSGTRSLSADDLVHALLDEAPQEVVRENDDKKLEQWELMKRLVEQQISMLKSKGNGQHDQNGDEMEIETPKAATHPLKVKSQSQAVEAPKTNGLLGNGYHG